MTITITWWVVAIVFFVIPFVYCYCRDYGGDYDMGIDIMMVTLPCWAISGTITVMKLVEWIAKLLGG